MKRWNQHSLEAFWCWYSSRRVWNNYNTESTPPLSWSCVMPGDSLLNELLLLHWGQTADSIRKMIMRYLLLSLRALCRVLSIELNNLHFKKDRQLLSWGWNQEMMVKLNSSSAKQQGKSSTSLCVSHMSGRADLQKKLFPQTDLHAHPAMDIKDTVYLTCFPVSPWWISWTKKKPPPLLQRVSSMEHGTTRFDTVFGCHTQCTYQTDAI